MIYIALVVLRLLQLATGLSCSRIREEIAAMNGVNFDANRWAFDYRTDGSDLIAEAVGSKSSSSRTSPWAR